MRETLPLFRHEFHDQYVTAKRCYMRIGHEYERCFAEAVGGRLAMPGEGCDVVTSHGKWEFCSAPNTKNSAGNNADHHRAGHRLVQVTGPTREGWLSAADFLEVHGIEHPDMVAADLAAKAQQAARQFGYQLALDVTAPG